jgi:hypothetical protein
MFFITLNGEILKHYLRLKDLKKLLQHLCSYKHVIKLEYFQMSRNALTKMKQTYQV